MNKALWLLVLLSLALNAFLIVQLGEQRKAIYILELRADGSTQFASKLYDRIGELENKIDSMPKFISDVPVFESALEYSYPVYRTQENK